MLSFITEKLSTWDRLKAEKRPIFIYGMGDGALKIMSVFNEKGITVSGVFASDDFVSVIRLRDSGFISSQKLKKWLMILL